MCSQPRKKFKLQNNQNEAAPKTIINNYASNSSFNNVFNLGTMPLQANAFNGDQDFDKWLQIEETTRKAKEASNALAQQFLRTPPQIQPQSLAIVNNFRRDQTAISSLPINNSLHQQPGIVYPIRNMPFNDINTNATRRLSNPANQEGFTNFFCQNLIPQYTPVLNNNLILENTTKQATAEFNQGLAFRHYNPQITNQGYYLEHDSSSLPVHNSNILNPVVSQGSNSIRSNQGALSSVNDQYEAYSNEKSSSQDFGSAVHSNSRPTGNNNILNDSANRDSILNIPSQRGIYNSYSEKQYYNFNLGIERQLTSNSLNHSSSSNNKDVTVGNQTLMNSTIDSMSYSDKNYQSYPNGQFYQKEFRLDYDYTSSTPSQNYTQTVASINPPSKDVLSNKATFQSNQDNHYPYDLNPTTSISPVCDKNNIGYKPKNVPSSPLNTIGSNNTIFHKEPSGLGSSTSTTLNLQCGKKDLPYNTKELASTTSFNNRYNPQNSQLNVSQPIPEPQFLSDHTSNLPPSNISLVDKSKDLAADNFPKPLRKHIPFAEFAEGDSSPSESPIILIPSGFSPKNSPSISKFNVKRKYSESSELPDKILPYKRKYSPETPESLSPGFFTGSDSEVIVISETEAKERLFSKDAETGTIESVTTSIFEKPESDILENSIDDKEIVSISDDTSSEKELFEICDDEIFVVSDNSPNLNREFVVSDSEVSETESEVYWVECKTVEETLSISRESKPNLDNQELHVEIMKKKVKHRLNDPALIWKATAAVDDDYEEPDGEVVENDKYDELDNQANSRSSVHDLNSSKGKDENEYEHEESGWQEDEESESQEDEVTDWEGNEPEDEGGWGC
ncbi:hypothetical protein G9A89_014781 [Geosiphon pyriformis]|nr:hypothetical protein G9A89_014781 [Geosiphon pyriformis]